MLVSSHAFKFNQRARDCSDEAVDRARQARAQWLERLQRILEIIHFFHNSMKAALLAFGDSVSPLIVLIADEQEINNRSLS